MTLLYPKQRKVVKALIMDPLRFQDFLKCTNRGCKGFQRKVTTLHPLACSSMVKYKTAIKSIGYKAVVYSSASTELVLIVLLAQKEGMNSRKKSKFQNPAVVTKISWMYLYVENIKLGCLCTKLVIIWQ
jgi:hypothetical protein